MLERLPSLDRTLLDNYQRDFPLVARPFAVMARQTGASEDAVIARLDHWQRLGTISRVGATVRPNTAGASTLAALTVPEKRLDDVVALVVGEEGVNHAYLREHDWNLWFVVTAPDRTSLDETLARIEQRSGLALLDLRLKRPFNIDLGFSLRGNTAQPRSPRQADLSALRETDRPILHALSQGLALVPTPYAALATRLGRDEADLIARIDALVKAHLITRLGVIVRHRSIGWKANAMVVWHLPEQKIDAAGHTLARLPGITLCYQRETVPGLWPYGLFAMIHARSRPEAQEVLDKALALPELADANHHVLFSTRCFKQTGAKIAAGHERTG